MAYVENLMIDYLNDELIRNPFPFPMDNVLDYLYSLSKNKEVRYMSEKLEEALRKYSESRKNVIEFIEHFERNHLVRNRVHDEQYARMIADESKAKVDVETEVYKLIGKSSSSQSLNLKEMLEAMKK